MFPSVSYNWLQRCIQPAVFHAASYTNHPHPHHSRSFTINIAAVKRHARRVLSETNEIDNHKNQQQSISTKDNVLHHRQLIERAKQLKKFHAIQQKITAEYQDQYIHNQTTLVPSLLQHDRFITKTQRKHENKFIKQEAIRNKIYTIAPYIRVDDLCTLLHM